MFEFLLIVSQYLQFENKKNISISRRIFLETFRVSRMKHFEKFLGIGEYIIDEILYNNTGRRGLNKIYHFACIFVR